MRSKWFIILMAVLAISCSQFNKGVIAKKELRKKKPPSVRIAEEYDKRGKKQKIITDPKRAAKVREKQDERIKKRGDRYLRKKRRKLK